MPSSQPRVAAILVAAGRGLRVGGEVPKQFRRLGGRSVMARSLTLFTCHPRVSTVVAVINPQDRALFDASLDAECGTLLVVSGGETRQQSSLAGLRALTGEHPDYVLIHDAARPFASPALIDRAIDAALAHGAAVPGTRVTDTMKVVDRDGLALTTPPREDLRAVQTPQAFRYDLILDLHERAAEAGLSGMTDDGAVAEWGDHPLHVFPGEASNMKLTTAEDLEACAQRLSPLAQLGDIRTGTGFDVHVFAPGDHVWLNGVRIPYELGLMGHSDADVGLHALTDAILGAIGEGDIGTHFPPSDDRWRGASSDRFLAHAAELVARRGGAIGHLDVTLVCERPKIGPFREEMRRRIAEIARIDRGRVGVKATTTEGLGFTGRREGIAAMAIASIRLPWGEP